MTKDIFEVECKKTQLCWLDNLADIIDVKELDNKCIVKVNSTISKELIEAELHRHDSDE